MGSSFLSIRADQRVWLVGFSLDEAAEVAAFEARTWAREARKQGFRMRGNGARWYVTLASAADVMEALAALADAMGDHGFYVGLPASTAEDATLGAFPLSRYSNGPLPEEAGELSALAGQ